MKNEFIINNGVTLKAYVGNGEKVVIPEGVLFVSGVYDKNTRERIKEIIFPSTCEKIYACAVTSCTLLESVSLPSTLKKIANCAFSECKLLHSVEIPSGVDIGSDVFSGCSSLKSITLNCPLKRKTGVLNGCNPTKIIGTKEHLKMSLDDLSCALNIDETQGKILALRLALYTLNTLKETGENFPLICDIKENKHIFSPLACLEFEPFEIEKYFTLIGGVSPLEIDRCIALATERERRDAVAFLVEYKNRTFTPEQIEKAKREREDKMLGIIPFDDCDYQEIFKFEKSKTRVKITKYIGYDKVVEIPEMLFGKTVYEIGADAFSGTGVEYVVLPKTVKKIGYGAFANCKNLKEINIPIGTTVDEKAFFGCDSLCDENGFFIVRGTLYHAVQKSSKTIIPNTVYHLAPYSFSGFDIDYLELPNTVRMVSNIVAYESKIKELHMPSGIGFVFPFAFHRCEIGHIFGKSGTSAEQFAKDLKIPFTDTEN